ncbi:MAG: type II secretion system F family protein [Polyangiales bacterium]
MAVFQFVGLSATTGKETRGVRDADNLKGLRSSLRREGIVLTRASESKAAEAKSGRDIQLFAFMNKPSVADIAMMTRQLGTLIRAGIPLTEAIGAIAEQADKQELKRILTSIREELNQGTAFAVALGEHTDTFAPLYINMVAAGEISGNLETVLDRLADFTDGQARLQGKVMAALAYPMVMLVIGSVLVTVLMMGVVPKVTAIFASLDRALPWYTALLITISNSFVSPVSHGLLIGTLLGMAALLFTRQEGTLGKQTNTQKQDKKSGSASATMLVVVAGGLLTLEVMFRESAMTLILCVLPGLVIGAVIGTFLAWLRTEPGRIARDKVLLDLPLFGSVVQMVAVARFARTLATLLASGVQILRAMEIVRAVIGNAAIEKIVEEAAAQVREGQSIAEPLRKSKRFPPIMTHMIAVGEKSGQLESMLEKLSDNYEMTVELRVAALTSLLEPLTIVVMGGAVAFIAFSILMPLIQMNDFNQ